MRMRMHPRGQGSARKGACSTRNQIVEIHKQSPLSNLRYDNGRQDVNAACQHVLHPGEPRRKHWLDLERPQADSVIKSAINKS